MALNVGRGWTIGNDVGGKRSAPEQNLSYLPAMTDTALRQAHELLAASPFIDAHNDLPYVIRIDKEALHIVDGQRGVYVKYGNLQRFLKIETLYEDENYILIPDNGKLGTDNEVRLYDEIIVQGTNLQDGKLL